MVNELRSEMLAKGYNPKELILDNKFHRFGDPDNQWFIGYEIASPRSYNIKYIIASFGDWRTGEYHVFAPRGKIPKEDTAHFQAEQDKLKAQIEKSKAEERDRTASAAIDLIAEYGQGLWHTPYMKRKNVSALYGAFPGIDSLGTFLAVPVANTLGVVRNIQKIRNDGEKRFLKGGEKRGLFHVLRGSVIGAKSILIAEGWATAATLADAIDEATVVCAFDAGNLKSVAQNIRRVNEGAQIVICADNDKVNPQTGSRAGIAAATEAAESCQGIVKLCPVEGKDFNDIGVEATQAYFEEKKPETDEGRGIRVTPLGFLGEYYFYASTYNQRLHQLKTFTTTELLKIAPLAYWQTMFPSKTGVDWTKATDSMIGNCVRVGIFDPDKMRSLGVWRESGEIVVHLGTRLWSPKSGTRSLLDPELNAFYELKASMPDVHPTPLSLSECGILQDFAAKLSVEYPHDAQMMIGWTACAMLGGLLKWRPHIWLTGEQGSGKTTALKDFICHLIGPSSVTLQGNSSEAGLRRETRFKNCPLIFEEFESMSKRDAEHVESCVAFIRQASSDSIGSVVKAAGESGTVGYSARFCACLASIKTNLQLEQDKARFTVIEFVKGKTEWSEIEVLYKAMSDDEWAARFRARVLHRAESFLKAVQTLKRAIPGSQRTKDQHAPLWAGWWILISDADMTDTDAADLVAFWQQREDGQGEPELESTEGQECLEFLLSSKISLPKGGVISVAEAIQKHGKSDPDSAMETSGLKYDYHANRLHVRTRSAELARLFSTQPKWSNWTQALSRLPGARKNTTCRYFGTNYKGIWVPVVAPGTD